jgi:uncharacterized protein YjdB
MSWKSLPSSIHQSVFFLECVECDFSIDVHLEEKGWLLGFKPGEIIGTVGESRRLEAIRINTHPHDPFAVRYRVHVKDRGWLPWVCAGEVSGTIGESRQVEAIQIDVNPAFHKKITCKAHLQDLGWSEWVHNNNEIAGTIGQSRRLEAFILSVNSSAINTTFLDLISTKT